MRSMIVACTVVVLVTGCSSSEPRTRYLSTDWRATLRKLTGPEPNVQRSIHAIHDINAPEEIATTEQVWIGMVHQGFVHVSITGSRVEKVCRVHLGPDLVRQAFPIDTMYDLIDDPVLARHVRVAVGPIDIEREYLVEMMVDGVRVRFEQRDTFEGPMVELLLDGCQRFPSRGESERRTGAYALNFTPKDIRHWHLILGY